MELKAFDLHSHLYFEQFNPDREAIMLTMEKAGIGTITVGTSVETSEQAIALSNPANHRFACIGIHPHEAVNMSEMEREKALHMLATFGNNESVVAVGETGLDYFRLPVEQEKEIKQAQQALFLSQLTLAHTLSLPVMIHCRDAYDDVLAMYSSLGHKLHMHFHFFTSDIPTLKRCLDIGATVSFPGVITFVAACEEVVRYVPLDRMMIETDAPFAAPVPYRGKRADPTMVLEVAHAVARIKGIDVDTILSHTLKNTYSFFPKTVQGKVK